MTQWTAEKRTELHKTFGAWTMIPERDGSETAYLLSHEDGLGLRVLPDSHNSAQKRGRMILVALQALESFNSFVEFHPDHQVAYLIGRLTIAGFTWASIGADPLEKWLTEWFTHDNDATPGQLAKFLVDDLDHAGWTITAKEKD